MAGFFNTESFIKKHITRRDQSLFIDDIKANQKLLAERINDRKVLVIGGAGTIGSSFIKSLLKFEVSCLYVVDTNENGLTELVRDLRSSMDYNIPVDFKTYPISYNDRVFENIVREKSGFGVVANFAAHKHVRSEKDQHSVQAMINNNVINAKGLLELLVEFPPQRFFCVSTDKATNPVNIMGASKKLMEDMIMSYAEKIPITTARFANVAFSNGSLLFGFIERMFKRQPLSSPADVRRYFISPEESGQICLLACMLGNSGEIFFPKLNHDEHMMTFSKIAEDFLTELGLEPLHCNSEQEARLASAELEKLGDKYPVYFFRSDTTGEKPYEEFYTEDEKIEMNRFSSLGVVTKKNTSTASIETTVKNLNALFETSSYSKSDIVEVLKTYLTNFDHAEKGKNLDQKM